jgi:hypothetical protein
MRPHRLFATFVAALAIAAGLFGGSTARAAPGRPAVVFGPPTEGTKVILNDTSIDGPAISATYAPATVLAWTGTDAAHHLNLLTSQDGLHYANKLVLPETSLWRPAVAFIDSGRGAPYGTIVLAWTGTDDAHTLNLELVATPDLTVKEKITFWGETSFTAPDVATVNGDVNSDVYLAWAGSDAAHTVNVLHHTTIDQQNAKQTLWGWSSVSRPNISHDQSPGSSVALILSWTGIDNHLYFATSADRAHWTTPATSPLGQQSAWAPCMFAFYATNMPTHWLAWTGSGTRSSQELTVQYTEGFPDWTDVNSKTTFGESAISGPELAYAGVTGQVLVGWTGTDAAHHLNLAVVSAPTA